MVFITFYGIICDTFCKFSWEVFPDWHFGGVFRMFLDEGGVARVMVVVK